LITYKVFKLSPIVCLLLLTKFEKYECRSLQVKISECGRFPEFHRLCGRIHPAQNERVGRYEHHFSLVAIYGICVFLAQLFFFLFFYLELPNIVILTSFMWNSYQMLTAHTIHICANLVQIGSVISENKDPMQRDDNAIDFWSRWAKNVPLVESFFHND
jgi:hypothetical protein